MIAGLQAATAGRESADTDLDAREVDIDALLSRDQPIFAISELAVFVRCRIRSLFCVPSICAISTLQASTQNPPIPGLSRWHKAELAAKEFSSTKSLFQFFSGCCFALPASRDSDLVQPMQSRTSSTKKGRSISSKSAAAASSPSSRRPVVPCSRRTSSPKMERPTPGTPGLLAFCRTPGAKRPCLRVSGALPGVLAGRSPGVLLGAWLLAARGRGQWPGSC